MNKEELLYELYQLPEFETYPNMAKTTHIHGIINKFFEVNVVIPKGENRHPYADVLHQWIEGAEIQNQYNNGAFTTVEDAKNMLSSSYRIKPQIVYEYLWMDLITPDTYECANGKHMTEDEASRYFYQSDTYFRVNETKRIRK